MSHISDGVYVCQTCKRKFSCPQCSNGNVVNNIWPTIKNEMKQPSKYLTYCSLATLVAIVAILSVSPSLFGLSFTKTCSSISPKDCYATGRGLKVAVVRKRANAVLYMISHRGNAYTEVVDNVTCKVLYESTNKKIDCRARKIRWNEYEISYQPTSLGRHQLHIKVEGEHIKGSPFTVIVIKKFGTPIKIISGVKAPWGVAVNQRGEILIVERDGYCISIFSATGEKFQSFGSQGSGPDQFNKPCGVVVDDDGNILVTDCGNDRILKYSSELKLITSVGRLGRKHLQFNYPFGVAISPTTKKIAIADRLNHRVQILNPDLTFNSSIGSRGSGSGQFDYPYDVAFDSAGNMYVADAANHCIKVFNPEGEFLTQFGNKRQGDGELDYPTGIDIDNDNRVYVVEKNNCCVLVFTCEGEFLTSFGSKGSGPGQFKDPRGITVDKNGVIYVSDTNNDRTQIF